jgi:serine/threonine protein kinase
VGSKHKRKESISARLALLKPQDEEVTRRELGEERAVQDEKRGERVAMLRLHEGALPNSKIRRSFDRQLKAIDGFLHPSVVEVLEGGTNDGEGRGFLISTLVEGKTLRETLADAPLPPVDAIGIAVDLLNGLAAGHWRWLVHGGVSPESILIVPEDGRPRAKILHYGFTPVVGEARETSFGESRVSLDYSAPEAIKGEPVDPRADVYSVGVLLFEMVTGRHPVPGTGNDPVRNRVLDQADALPKDAVADADLYTRLKSALKRALEKDPSKRFCSARSFALALTGEPLPSEDPFEDPWGWPEACPEGGTCAASGASIPPLCDRSWSKKQSDRPFRCRVTGKDYAGSEHWDSRGLCSRGGRHRPLPAPEGDAPEDVIYDDLLDAPEIAEAPQAAEPAAEPEAQEEPKTSEPAEPRQAAEESVDDAEASAPETEKLDRRAAILELLKDDARVAGILDDDSKSPSEAKPEPAKAKDDDALVMDPVLPKEERDRSSSGRDLSDSTTIKVEEAFLDAWDGAKRQTQAATSRMKRKVTRSASRPEPLAEGEELARPVVGRPQTSEPAVMGGDPFRWQVATAVLAIVVVMIGLRLNKEIEATRGALQKYGESERKLQEAHSFSGQVSFDLAAREKELVAITRKEKQARADLGTTRGQVQRQERELGTLKRSLQTSERSVAAKTEELKKAQAAGAALKSQLQSSTAAGKALEAKLASAKSEAERLKETLGRTESALSSEKKTSRGLEGALGIQRTKVTRLEEKVRLALKSRDTTLATLTRTQDELVLAKKSRDDIQAALATSRAAEEARQRELSVAKRERDQARAELTRVASASAQHTREVAVLKGRVKELEAALAKLTRERSDLLVELADLEAEREQLDAEGLQLERWLRESEARNRASKGAQGGAEQTSALRLRSVAVSGQAKDSTSLNLTLGERGLAVVEAAALNSVLKKAQKGEVLLTLRVRCKGGPPVLKLQGFLTSAQVDRPTLGGRVLRLEKVGADQYRVWLTKQLLASYRSPASSAGFGVLLMGGSNPSQVASVELRASPLSEDGRALLERVR